MTKRTELQAEVVRALNESNAVDFDALGTIIAKFGPRAAGTGDAIGLVINWRLIDFCIPPEPYQQQFVERVSERELKT
ncbi:hypothetical protein [Burkholderia ubonensis]|uniref:hypothetical protein n=1 Tax=Burkholderia ubonensis TaxID=101571 RepID=UPI00075B9852|nr:hypothetical protein [Burkholderia ubonensis]KVZ03665.1 hypothetical protein WL11_15845 [Burkholderia ubonensis]